MMTKDEISARIIDLVERHNPKGLTILLETDLTEELEIDSVAAMDLVMEIEEEFDLNIPVNEVADLRTVGDLVELVARELRGREP